MVTNLYLTFRTNLSSCLEIAVCGMSTPPAILHWAASSLTARTLSRAPLVPNAPITLEEAFSVLCVVKDQLDMYPEPFERRMARRHRDYDSFGPSPPLLKQKEAGPAWRAATMATEHSGEVEADVEDRSTDHPPRHEAGSKPSKP